MFDVQQAEVATSPPPAQIVGPVMVLPRSCPAPTTGEVVVCGRKDDRSFRLGPMPDPPPAEGLLSRPLRFQLAPGISFGFQRGGGFGLRTEFGPRRKSGE